MRDSKAFRERFLRWKNGEQVYDKGRIIRARFGLDGEEETDAIVVRNRLVPIEVQERWSPAFAQKRQQTLEEANARNLAAVNALNLMQISSAEYVSPLLLEYYANKEDTRRFMQRKQKGEELADKIFGTAFDIATLYAPTAKLALGAAKQVGKATFGAIKKVVTNPSNTSKVILSAARKFNPADVIDNDVAARYYLSGAETPRFDYIYHGRGTYRGEPEDVVRNYSPKDVGLHVSPRRATAERFARMYDADPGVVYLGIDINPPQLDFIASDLRNWSAMEWKESLEGSKRLIPEIQEAAYSTFSPDRVDAAFSRSLSIRDIIHHYGLDDDDIIARGMTMELYRKQRDAVMMEAANKEFAEYLSEHGVKFDYKNDFEGGGYTRPSRFISNPSDVWWDKVIYANPVTVQRPAISIAKDIPFIKNGTLIPGVEKIQRFSYNKRIPWMGEYWYPFKHLTE